MRTPTTLVAGRGRLYAAARARDDERAVSVHWTRTRKQLRPCARPLKDVFADDDDLAEPPPPEIEGLRSRRLVTALADPALAKILFPDDRTTPAWTAAGVAALRGHCDCAAACLARPARGRDRMEGDGVGVLTAGVLGGGDVASLGEALAGAARVPTASLARSADRKDANFGGCRPMLLAAALGRADALRALARLGADSDAFVEVERDDAVAAAARAARCEGAFEACNREVDAAEAAAGPDDLEARVKKASDADAAASKV